jgi:alpha-1,2-mannosyltransferase
MTTLPTAARRALPPLVFLGAALAFAALSLACARPPCHPGRTLGFFDLKVYRAAAGLILHGRPLYGARFRRGVSFTYPPYSAVVFGALRLLPLGADEVVITVLNVALVLVIARCALRLVPGAAQRPALAWIGAAAMLWSEPVMTAIGYGQIDLLVAALVVYDLSRPARRESAGVAIGIASGLKLTPLIFIPYLLLAGRVRMGMRAALVFAVTVLLGYFAAPWDSRVFWTGAVFNTSHVTGRGGTGAGAGPADQSLRGLLLRIDPSMPHTVWPAVVALVAVAGLTLAARTARRGDRASGFVLTAVTGLLVSPVSWTHHWALAVPGLLIAVAAAARRGRRAQALVAAGALALAAATWLVWPVIAAHQRGLALSALDFVTGDVHVFAGLGVLVAYAALEWRRTPALALTTIRRDRSTAPASRASAPAGSAAGAAPGGPARR